MRLLEYEAKRLLQGRRIPIPKGELLDAAKEHSGAFPVMLKSQVPIGKRGKSGGVIRADSQQGVKEGVGRLLEKDMGNFRPRLILAEEMLSIEAEYYIAVTYDTVAKRPLVIFSTDGGVDVEELAKTRPERIIKRRFSFTHGLFPYQAREIASEGGVSGKELNALTRILVELARIFMDYDAVMVEVNPLARVSGGGFVALDCHIEIDDDAMYRQKESADAAASDERYVTLKGATEFERKAAEIDLLDHRGVAGRVVEFDGDLGLIIGGGGASLTAFDAVQSHGGRPANYCEIGGNPSVRKVAALTEHILSRPGLKKIAVIMNVVSNTRADLVARGIIKGVVQAGADPSERIAVFRVPGAWEDEAAKILTKYRVPYVDRSVSIDQAARIAVDNTY